VHFYQLTLFFIIVGSQFDKSRADVPRGLKDYAANMSRADKKKLFKENVTSVTRGERISGFETLMRVVTEQVDDEEDVEDVQDVPEEFEFGLSPADMPSEQGGASPPPPPPPPPSGGNFDFGGSYGGMVRRLYPPSRPCGKWLT
jgi:hypothetical protein